MTAGLDRPPLEEALGIPGAQAVSLLDPDGPTVLWWGGVIPPDDQSTTAVVTLAAAATGLVMVSDPGDELGDVLLTSSDMFHVVRLVPDGQVRIAHLTLRRAGANLAMARREFQVLIDNYLRGRRPPAITAGPGETTAAIAPPAVRTFPAAPSYAGASGFPAAPGSAGDPDTSSLPQRRRGESATPAATADTPDLFSLLGQPYLDDVSTLDRILDKLRRL